MSERPTYSEGAQSILRRANIEAERLGHEYIGTEHVLLGLLHEDEGGATGVLKALQVDRGALIAQVDATVRRGSAQMEPYGGRPFTSRTKRSLELAAEEATAFGHGSISPEHLLLGLLDERGNLASQLLNQAGVTREIARREMSRVRGTPPG
jgi:ATP-dependent Clp protease ATP-binding subunit ClpC